MDYCSQCAKCIFDEHAGTYRCQKRKHTILMPSRYLACEEFSPSKARLSVKDLEEKMLEETKNELS